MKVGGGAAVSPALEVYIRETVAELRQTWRFVPFVVVAAMPLAVALVALVASAAYPALDGAAAVDRAATLAALFVAVTVPLLGTCLRAALDRAGGVVALKFVSPLPPAAYAVAKVAAAAAETLAMLAVIVAVAVGLDATLGPRQWFELALLDLTAAVQASLIGVGIGTLFGAPRAAAVVAGLAGLTVVGVAGILALDPSWLAAAAWLSPPGAFARLGLALAGAGRWPPLGASFVVVAATVAAGALAAAGIRRAAA